MVTTAPEDNSISRHQCVIDVVPPNVYVSDAGSTHGTYVNGQLIGKKGQEDSARSEMVHLLV